MPNAEQRVTRRDLMVTAGAMSVVGAVGTTETHAAAAAPTADAGRPGDLVPHDARHLIGLTERLAKAPRRRDFKTVPMILTERDQWDHEAFKEVLAYQPAAKQASDNTEIGGSWLNGMRNTINAEVWGFHRPDFLAVSATHGSAQMALYDQATWDKYQLASLAGGKLKTNTLIEARPMANADPANIQDPAGVFSSANNSIPTLMRRGAVFLACHNAAWEHATHLVDNNVNPDHLSIDALAAELTNHLVPGVILTPGIVAALYELAQAGYRYVK